ncbi:MAG: hypothetical protein ACI9FZ_000883 [Bacteroidia bacterium]|jgi:hypothetical protein
MVGPTGLLCPLRIFEAQRSLLKDFVKPAGSQVQTAAGRAPIKKPPTSGGLFFHGRADRV